MMNVETPIETKLLIIPAKDVDEYDIMETAEQIEMVSTASSRCLQHTVQNKVSGARSHPSRKFKGRSRKKNMFGFNTSRNRYDTETHMSLKSSFAPPFASSKVFPDNKSSYPYLYTSEGQAPAFEQLNFSYEPDAADITKEEEKPSVLLKTSANKIRKGKNNSEITIEEKESTYWKKERNYMSHEEKELLENNLTEDEENIVLPFKKAPMAGLREEEEEEEEENHDDTS